MNKLILCEGETDAILLSYYLEKAAGWNYSSKPPQNLSIQTTAQNETVNWYKKDENYLMICAVGGKDNFGNFFNKKIKNPLLLSDAFAKIAFVTDRDERDAASIETALSSALQEFDVVLKNNQWVDCSYTNDFGMDKKLQTLLVVIPTERQGALETVMLSAIAENDYDKNIVAKAGIFADQMRVEASRYIFSERLKLKAHLGLTWAVQYPEKVFTKIDEQIRNVRWEESESLHTCFAVLTEI